MNAKDIKMILTVALGTATLTVVTFLSGSSIADGDGQSAKIAQPKLVANGVEMTLTAADGQIFKAGDEPTFALNAVNTTGEPANVTVSVSMTSSSPQDMLSRVPRMPARMWQANEMVSLGPKESKVLKVFSQTKLPANQIVSVWLAPVNSSTKDVAQKNVKAAAPRLQISEPGIVAMNISTSTNALGTALNLVQSDNPTPALISRQVQALTQAN